MSRYARTLDAGDSGMCGDALARPCRGRPSSEPNGTVRLINRPIGVLDHVRAEFNPWWIPAGPWPAAPTGRRRSEPVAVSRSGAHMRRRSPSGDESLFSNQMSGRFNAITGRHPAILATRRAKGCTALATVVNKLFTTVHRLKIGTCKCRCDEPCRTRTCDLLLRRSMQVPGLVGASCL